MVNQTILDLLNIWLVDEKIIIIITCSSRHYKNSSCSVDVMSKFFSPVDWLMAGFPVVHYFPEITQTHVHWVSDAIQPSHPLSSPSPPGLNLFQHQGLFQWVSFLRHMVKVLELQHQSFQWIFRVDFLISLQSKRLSRVFSSTTVWKHQIFSAQPPLQSNSQIHMWLLEKA